MSRRRTWDLLVVKLPGGMVALPSPLADVVKALGAGFETIADIAREVRAHHGTVKSALTTLEVYGLVERIRVEKPDGRSGRWAKWRLTREWRDSRTFQTGNSWAESIALTEYRESMFTAERRREFIEQHVNEALQSIPEAYRSHPEIVERIEKAITAGCLQGERDSAVIRVLEAITGAELFAMVDRDVASGEYPNARTWCRTAIRALPLAPSTRIALQNLLDHGTPDATVN